MGDFTEQAGAYHQGRPGYPAALVARMIERAGVRAGDPVAEIGAGTGLFTQRLSAHGLRVIAIEPGDAMREHAEQLEGVTWQAGSFEATGLPSQSQAWVVAAQAFHWADPPRALPEIRRVLEPGGTLSILWNDRENESHELLAWSEAAALRHVPEYDFDYRELDWPVILTSTGDFHQVETDSESHCVELTRAHYLDFWRSVNRLAAVAGPQRYGAFLEELATHLRTLDDDVLRLPFRCRSWTVRRL